MNLRLPMRASFALSGILLAGLVHPVPNARAARRLVWHGEESWEQLHLNPGRISPASGEPNRFKLDAKMSFTYVQETDDAGKTRFVSRHLTWTSKGESEATGTEKIVCKGAGGVDLGPSTAADEVPESARDDLKIDCKSESLVTHFGYFIPTPTPHGTRYMVPPHLVAWDKLRNDCSYSEESPGYRYSVWVTVQFDAVVDVSTETGSEYEQFDPGPGETLTVAARVRPSIPAYFKFMIQRDEVSRFPGYATNANIDDGFYAKFPALNHLRGRYKNDDPDLFFDPENFKGDVWKQPARGNAVETAKPQGSAIAIVTAMDYGAYGKLRAYAKAQCGGWQPAVFKIGNRESDHVTIPRDEDGNLMSDGLKKYTGNPGADNDGKPVGDGMPGDGFTTFEEYRGFMIAGDDCGRGLVQIHKRTDPSLKTLFVKSDDPLLLKMALLLRENANLDLYGICSRQYVDDNTRIVNFTLQQSGQKKWFGKTLSQDKPQHGIHLIDERLIGGMLGVTCGSGADCSVPPGHGPPRNVKVVKVDKEKGLRLGGAVQLAHTVMHELGHAIGIYHHGEGNIEGPVAILSVPACPAGTTAGTVDGKTACLAEFIATRNQQNSGDQDCPMKYIRWGWYVPPSAALRSVGQVRFRFQGGSRGAQMLPGYVGRLKKYRKDIDRPGISEYCTSAKGTGINALPGDQNHAGNATLAPCAKQIHVNDAH